MKFFSRIFAFLVLLLLTTPSFAKEPPFTWPESYVITTTETSKIDKNLHFVNLYNQSGLYVRNDNEKFGVSITRPDKGKEYSIAKNGDVTVRRELPANYGQSSFLKNAKWEMLDKETLNGREAIKYRISDKLHLRILWISSDLKTPLRFEEDDKIVEYSNYVIGPQDPKLFELPIGKM